MTQQLIVQSARVVLPDGVRPATIRIRDEQIASIGEYGDRIAGVDHMDVADRVVLPGLVDTHVHVNEPGRTDWEGFEHATKAAAAGGVTTIVDMPLNSIPATTTVKALEIKRRAAEGHCHIDVAFWGGVVPGNSADLEPLARAGVPGFKCFLAPSGVEEFANVNESDLRDALPILASLGLPLLVHAELPAMLRQPSGDPRQYATWLNSRPPISELAAIDLMIALARETHARVHIVHLASPGALPAIADARRRGCAITVETCPHYLTFAAETIPDGDTAFKCAPPIRSKNDRDQLWTAVANGEIDLIASDHSPAPPALKLTGIGDFVRAWGGIASLQLGLAAVWTGAQARGLPFGHLARWMSSAPAALAGLTGRKGAIATGCDADLVVWDPDASTPVDPSMLYSRHGLTPYAGMTLDGRVRATLVRGEVVFDDESGVRATPRGRLLAKGV